MLSTDMLMAMDHRFYFFVYRHYDANDNCLYVGQALNPFTRLSERKMMYLNNWFLQIKTVKIDRYDTYEEALTAESVAIFNEQPIHNINHKKARMRTPKEQKAMYKQIQESRRVRIENVKFLKDQLGSWAELGRALGKSPEFLIQIAGDNSRRSIGEALARNIEQSAGVPSGWLDIRH